MTDMTAFGSSSPALEEQFATKDEVYASHAAMRESIGNSVQPRD
jgi:hypothetical protein